jgi:hypothetical protein
VSKFKEWYKEKEHQPAGGGGRGRSPPPSWEPEKPRAAGSKPPWGLLLQTTGVVDMPTGVLA